MAELIRQSDKLSEQTNKEKEIKAKVVAFSRETAGNRSISVLKTYFNMLCPTIEDKVMFVAMYNKMYPDQVNILKYLAEWLDEAFLNYCNNKVVKEEINRLAKLYKDLFVKKPNNSKMESYGAGNMAPTWQDSERYKQYTDPYNYVNVEKSKTEEQKKEGLLSRIFRKVFKPKAEISKVSIEEVNRARPEQSQTYSQDKVQEQIRIERYNNRVKERVEKMYAQPALYKGESAMHW